jgi:hypothetical protein
MTPTHSAMNNATVFARAGRTLIVRQCHVAEGELLLVLGDDHESRSYAFTEARGLQLFRRRLEDFLIETGWSLFRFGDGVGDAQTAPARPATAATA